MKKFLWSIALGCMLLNGCDRKPEVTIPVSALPLLQQAVASQVPVFNGHWNKNIMDKVCQLASGEVTQQAFNGWFISHQVDVNQLAIQDPGFKFISQLDSTKAAPACAAWLITSVIDPVKVWGEEINSDAAFQKQYAPLTPIVARTIDFIAALAKPAGQQRFADTAAYQHAVIQALNKQSSDFIQLALNSRIIVADYQKPGTQSAIYEYRIIQGDPVVRFNGENWLGQGMIKGIHRVIELNQSQ